MNRFLFQKIILPWLLYEDKCLYYWCCEFSVADKISPDTCPYTCLPWLSWTRAHRGWYNYKNNFQTHDSYFILKLTCWCSINAKLKGIPESPVCYWQSPTPWHPYPGHQSWTWPESCHERHERYNCYHHCNSTSCCHRYCHQQEMLGLNCSDLAFWVQSSAFGFWIQISFSV